MATGALLVASCSGASATIGPDPEVADAATPPADATTATTTMMPGTADASMPIAIDAGGCPALTYPSGVVIQSFPNDAMTATYAKHLASGEDAPTCFLDADNLVNPMTGEVYAITVNVSTDFQLEDLVGTEINQGYGHIVLMKPEAVASLQKFRDDAGIAVDRSRAGQSRRTPSSPSRSRPPSRRPPRPDSPLPPAVCGSAPCSIPARPWWERQLAA